MSTDTIKAWLFVHKWTSLVCTLFLLMLCITGLPLIFWHEIEHAMSDVEPAAVPPGTERASLDDMVARAREASPDEVMQYISADPEEPDLWYLSMGKTADAPEVSVYHTFDAHTGEILDTWTLGNPGFMDVMWQLHYDMYAGLPGTLFLGGMGLLFVLSLISGVVLYAPFMRKLTFGSVRKHRSPRIQWLDLHNLLGIAALIWLLVVGATGVINTLSVPIFGHWQSTELAALTAPFGDRPGLSSTPSVERAVAGAQAYAADSDLSFIAFPGNEYASPNHFVAYMYGNTPLRSRLLTPLLIDARTAEVVDSSSMPWYVTALLISQPLHFGDYGGIPLKILWALLDIFAIVVLGSGVYLWLKKSRLSLDARLRALQGGTGEGADRRPVPVMAGSR